MSKKDDMGLEILGKKLTRLKQKQSRLDYSAAFQEKRISKKIDNYGFAVGRLLDRFWQKMSKNSIENLKNFVDDVQDSKVVFHCNNFFSRLENGGQLKYIPLVLDLPVDERLKADFESLKSSLMSQQFERFRNSSFDSQLESEFYSVSDKKERALVAGGFFGLAKLLRCCWLSLDDSTKLNICNIVKDTPDGNCKSKAEEYLCYLEEFKSVMEV